MKILSIRCRVKPQSPREVGATSWEVVKKAMQEQENLPLAERIRPCHRQKPYYAWWWIKQCPWCMKCQDSEWHLEMDGRKETAVFEGIEGKKVELVVQETGEVLQYEIGKGFK